MRGLMARYAVGTIFNPDKGYLCGLKPCHFVTMATPHCGCDADGVAQVCVCVCVCGGVGGGRGGSGLAGGGERVT
jgi:hypothetical protein